MLKPLFLISITGAVLAATSIVACGGTSTCTGDACGTGGSTGSTTSTTSTTTGTGGATTTGTGGAGGQGGATTTTTTTTTTGTGGGSGSSCGGKMGKTCPVGEYCDYPDNICGAADGTGICTAKPQVCPDLYMPTCACDGMVYSSPCDAAGAGFDENNNAGCSPPAGLFPCGSKFCDVKTQYCQRSLTDVGGTSDTYACVSLPAGCGNAPSCACLTNEPCGPSCASSGDGLILTCPGG
jgi:hypothetical protein